jgi:hypothetical protein
LPEVILDSDAVVELGSGVLPTHVTNKGHAAVGTFDAVGNVRVLGSVTNDVGGYLYFDVSAVEPNKFDLLQVHRNLDLQGTIRIVFRGGFAPAAGDMIPLVYFPELSNTIISLTPQNHASMAEMFEFANILESPVIELFIQDSILGVAFRDSATFVPEPSTTVLVSWVLLAMRKRRVARA